MPAPLTIKRPGIASKPMQFAVGVLVAGPLLGVWYAWRNNIDIHLNPPWLNFAAHAALVVVPLIWAFLISAPRVQFEQTEEELLGTSTFFDRLPMDWWTMFMMWPVPIFALVELIVACSTDYLAHPEDLSTSPTRALMIMALTLALGLFYATLLLGKSEPRTLVSNAGLRTDLIRFFEWDKIDHISRNGELYALYHQVNPKLPATCFRVRDPQLRAKLESYIAEHSIPVSNTTHPSFTLTKLGVICGFSLNLAFCFWLRFNTSLSALWIIPISFGFGIVQTLLLEKFRGLSKFGRYMPVIEGPQESV